MKNINVKVNSPFSDFKIKLDYTCPLWKKCYKKIENIALFFFYPPSQETKAVVVVRFGTQNKCVRLLS